MWIFFKFYRDHKREFLKKDHEAYYCVRLKTYILEGYFLKNLRGYKRGFVGTFPKDHQGYKIEFLKIYIPNF